MHIRTLTRIFTHAHKYEIQKNIKRVISQYNILFIHCSGMTRRLGKLEGMVLTTALETHYPPDSKIHLLMLPAYCTVENSLGIDHLHENQNDFGRYILE